ncbi:hypothetical protein ANN_06713 [Periplaneta americana]|uniref:Transposable element Tc3 transposase n=1 Tax=Periplaneta americana TaxID=6978 RepID=A0ABQ8TEX8_PERAM|nr:hypothetical protein ANN_06713 [Periplaneta americana]
MVARWVSAFRTGRNETAHVAHTGRLSIYDKQVELQGLLAVETIAALYENYPSRQVRRSRTATGDANAASVLAKLVVSPSRSTREVAQECGTSQASPNLEADICWSDEVCFHLNGTVNRHSAVYWATENPHIVVEAHNQFDLRLNVWCGIHGDVVIGPVFLNNKLTAALYRWHLEVTLLPYLDDLPLERRRGFFFQQDGTLPHFRLTVRELLNEVIHGCWIGSRDPVEWLPKSPDLTPLDFFLWGHFKSVVYSNRPRKLDELQENIRREYAQITPAVLRNVWSSYLNHVWMRRQPNGHQFEHLLH